ncbi:MAG TPA: hypothetical protein VFC16_20470 [Nakamurella sp.]|nr:hypothetical protein [Nakamurella sp.]
MTVAAVVFLIVYAWQVLGELQGSASASADVILTITWVMFAIDYVARLVLARRRWSWFGRHLLDLAIVALPILRPLRLVRLVVLLAIFQRVAGRTLRGRVVVYIAGSTILLIFVTALAVLDAERHEPGASIQTAAGRTGAACHRSSTTAIPAPPPRRGAGSAPAAPDNHPLDIGLPADAPCFPSAGIAAACRRPTAEARRDDPDGPVPTAR